MPAPARRTLENQGIKSLKQLSKYSKDEILKFHGIGTGLIPKLDLELETVGLSLRK
jgi:DNA-directed RNA polymerase alpha subunit